MALLRDAVSEAFAGAPDQTCPTSAYGEGKRAAEFLACAAASAELEVKIARCFAFVGPYLPLDANYAAGNFVADALAGRTIRVQGDGTAYRTYLYASDLAIWLWTILFRGVSRRAYHVGAETAVSIGELAALAAQCGRSGLSVELAKPPEPGAQAQRYVPSTRRARQELQLAETVELKEGILRTLRWHEAGGATLCR